MQNLFTTGFLLVRGAFTGEAVRFFEVPLCNVVTKPRKLLLDTRFW